MISTPKVTLMSQTLQSKYKNQQISRLREHAQKIDRELLKERRANHTLKLMLEAMSPADLANAEKIINKLTKLKGIKGMDNLHSAIDQSISDINKYTGQGGLEAGWSALKDLVGIKNPLVKLMTLSAALEQGFAQIPSILKNHGIEKPENDEITLNDMITDQKQIESIKKNIAKALTPPGIFGALKGIPYIKADQLAFDIMNASVKQLGNAKTIMSSGPNATELGDELQQNIGQGGPSTPTKTSSGTEQSNASTSTDVGKKTEPSTEKPVSAASQDDTKIKNQTNQLYKDISNDFAEYDENTVKNIISILILNDKIKT